MKFPSFLTSRRAVITISAATALMAGSAGASQPGKRQAFTDNARVINSQPIYRNVTYERPVQECWLEEQEVRVDNGVYQQPDRRTGRRNNNAGSTIIGGVVGGAIGNQIGRHSDSKEGRIGATVLGAIIGSAIANESQGGVRKHRRYKTVTQPQVRHQPVYQTETVKRCENRTEHVNERKISGYQVTYSYHGQTYTTTMDNAPGSTIPVRVSVQPIGR